MRRTRGDMGRRRLRAAAAREAAVPFFRTGVLLAVDFFFAEAFVAADLGAGGFTAAGGFDWDVDGLAEAVGEVCWENAGTQFRSPPSAPSASTRRNLKPNRTTLIISREDASGTCNLRCRTF
jgi:hypothetical protein